MSADRVATGAELANRIASILSRRGLSVHQVSLRSAAMYGPRSLHFIPHNLYHGLETGAFSPSLHHMFALSRISGYFLADWFRVFGLALENIPRLQVALTAKRTVLLDSSLVDANSWMPWFRDRPRAAPPSKIAPLSQWLEPAAARRVGSLRAPDGPGFLYAKIGTHDTFAFPDLLPGSIVRLDPRVGESLQPEKTGHISESLFLIKHSKGLCCARLSFTRNGCVIPVSAQIPFAPVGMRLGNEVRVLGVVELEFRSLVKPEEPEIPEELVGRWKPEPLDRIRASLGGWLRAARQQAALSFRDASARSREIADSLGDERYFVAPSSLSDYEVSERPPRHVHKIITLCTLYGLPFAAFLAEAGLKIGDAGHEPIPDDLVSRGVAAPRESRCDVADQPSGGLLTCLVTQWTEPPLVLGQALESLSGMRTHSLRDFFWLGQERDFNNPHLQGGVLAIVNRHKKRPVYLPCKPWRQQPVYLLVRRDGTYLCACCSREDGILVLHGYSGTSRMQDQALDGGEAEIVGEIAAIMRQPG